MKRRIQIQWTHTAKAALENLPKKTRRIILEKTRALSDCDDPRTRYKSLTGPLKGYNAIKVGRYRVLYQVREEELANGDVYCVVYVIVVFVGMRKEGDRKDVYSLAQNLLRYANKEIDEHELDEDSD